MKETLTLKILNTIENSIFKTADIIDVITSGYHESYRKMRMHSGERRSSSIDKLKEKQNFYNTLYYLQKQNLVMKEGKSRNPTIWSITKKGRTKLQQLKEKSSNNPFQKEYPINKSNNSIIVIFDIPEVYKRKRDWLRAVLKRLKYKIIQKSVWMGHNALPSAFLKDLKDYNLMDYVQIFSIYKSGTISP